MRIGWGRQAVLASAVLVSGCAGVPQLYKPSRIEPDKALAPKVEHIVERISCELAGISATHLKDRHYVITVLLTLQVDDEINLTPSLSFIEPLTVASTNRILTQSMGVGGSRQRSFTATFYFDSKALLKHPACDAKGEKKLYRLDGNLGLADIARDGIGIHNRQTELLGVAPTAPSFASQIKFVVSRSVGALGPTWTLISFKGPGGANGLLNGKALTTDSVSVAFAPKPAEKVDPAITKLIEALEALVKALERREERAKAEFNTASVALARLQVEQANRPKFVTDAQVRSAERTVESATRERDEAARLRAEAQDNLEKAQAAAAEAAMAASIRSQENAIEAGRTLINTMILQNLNAQPR